MGWTLLLNWRTYAVLGYVALAGWGQIQTWRLHSAQTDLKAVTTAFEAFKAQVAQEGKAAQDRADLQAKQDLQAKEKADHENKATVTLLNQRISSLRYDREHSGQYGVPSPSPNPGSPERTCFKSTEFERAVSGFVEGAAAIIEECDGIRTALDTAKTWAAGR